MRAQEKQARSMVKVAEILRSAIFAKWNGGNDAPDEITALHVIRRESFKLGYEIEFCQINAIWMDVASKVHEQARQRMNLHFLPPHPVF